MDDERDHGCRQKSSDKPALDKGSSVFLRQCSAVNLRQMTTILLNNFRNLAKYSR